MGLKSGSRDAGLDDSEDSNKQSTDQEQSTGQEMDIATSQAAESRETPSSTAIDTTSESVDESKTGSQRPTIESLPYKLRREKVNEGREQIPYFLREDVIESESELQDTLEEQLGEDVYKSDYREAAMVVAQRNPELVAEVLREWGYDLNNA